MHNLSGYPYNCRHTNRRDLFRPDRLTGSLTSLHDESRNVSSPELPILYFHVCQSGINTISMMRWDDCYGQAAAYDYKQQL
jgi:hypothetical protein